MLKMERKLWGFDKPAGLRQRLANHRPQAKSSFVGTTPCSFVDVGSVATFVLQLLLKNKLSNYDRGIWPTKPKLFPIRPSKKIN